MWNVVCDVWIVEVVCFDEFCECVCGVGWVDCLVLVGFFVFVWNNLDFVFGCEFGLLYCVFVDVVGWEECVVMVYVVDIEVFYYDWCVVWVDDEFGWVVVDVDDELFVGVCWYWVCGVCIDEVCFFVVCDYFDWEFECCFGFVEKFCGVFCDM